MTMKFLFTANENNLQRIITKLFVFKNNKKKLNFYFKCYKLCISLFSNAPSVAYGSTENCSGLFPLSIGNLSIEHGYKFLQKNLAAV